MPRTIDASLPPPTPPKPTTPPNPSIQINTPPLPKPFEYIPSTTTNLRSCALHQIQSLVSRRINPLEPQDDSPSNDSLEDALDDGFLLCDLSTIRAKLLAWQTLFPRIKPFFALKCNPDPMVASLLGSTTPPSSQHSLVGFDCASISEIKLALDSCGNGSGAGRRCVYANPQRSEEELTEALSLGVEALTFDGEEELYKIARIHRLRVEEWQTANGTTTAAPPSPPEMILRVLVPDTTSTVPLGEKFGAPPSSIPTLTHLALSLSLPIIGVSFHCGSGCHSPDAYGTAIRIAKEAVGVMDGILGGEGGGGRVRVVDIGGGFSGVDGVGGDWGRFSGGGVRRGGEGGEGGAKEIAEVVTPLIDELFPVGEEGGGVEVIAEPGRYFVEAAFAYCARIYTVRVEDDRRHYYIAQGVRGLFKDVLLCGETFTPLPLLVDEEGLYSGKIGVDSEDKNHIAGRETEECYPSTVHGPSGEEFDLVCADCRLPLLRIGDWLVFDRMGAYTLSIAARNSCLPIRYVMGRGRGGGGEGW